MKPLARLLPLLVVAFVGWLWLGQRDGRIRAQAQAAALTVRADSLAGLWQADSAGRARADSLHAAEDSGRAAELARRAGALREARAATGATLARLDSVRAVAGQEGASLVDSLAMLAVALRAVDSLEVEVAACGITLNLCGDLAAARQGRILDLEVRDRNATALIGSLEIANRALGKLARPGLIRRVEQALPYMAVALIVGVLIR